MMIPHAKIVLFLLVAASKAYLVLLTGYPVIDVLHSDVRDPATASASTGIDSLTAQNKLADQGREVTRISKAGGDAIINGKQILPPNKKLFVPNNLKHDEVKAMESEYKSLELLLDTLPTHLTAPALRECQNSEKEFLGVLQKLREYHERYLRGPTDDSPEARRAMVNDLSDLFNDITFRHPRQYAAELSDEALEIMHTKRTLHLKTSFEKCVFKTLDYLYRFHFIDQKEMSSFFNSPEALQRTATHMPDLFSGPKSTFTAHHVFIPELDFILKDWHTEHLHLCLQDLDREVQQRLIYETLKITRQEFDKVVAATLERHREEPELVHQLRSPKAVSINEFVFQEDFLHKLQEQPPSELKQDIQEMIDFFLSETHDPNLWRSGVVLNFEKLELLLNYYALLFIMQYAKPDLKKLIEELTKGEDFESKFKWTTLGLTIQRLSDRRLDFEFFSTYPPEARSIIPTTVSNEKPNIIDLRLRVSRADFAVKQAKLGLKTADGLPTRKCNALSRYLLATNAPFPENSPYYGDHWNSWVIMTGMTIPRQPPDEGTFHQLMDHLLFNYNGLDLRPKEWESIKKELLQTAHSRWQHEVEAFAALFQTQRFLRI